MLQSDKSDKSDKMDSFPACAALIVDVVEASNQSLNIEAVKHLITTKSSLLPLIRRRCRRRRRRVLIYQPSGFNLDDYTDDWCIEFLRFSQEEIREIIPFLRLDLITWRNRYSATPEVAFCLLLYKLSWPHRLKDSLYIFGRSISWQSSIYLDILRYLVARYWNMLFWDYERLSINTIQSYT
jgi:hypothetical protein